ncbi:C163A protein, partial [Heliornis fulica]|nr:C163A protein [Heliornis fulica]
ELRLVDGGGPCAGRLEVKLQGHWGSVRDGNWNMDDAEVVCQQLGCGSAAGAYTASTRFRKGTGFISLARVDCQGDEPALWYCKIHGWGPYHGIHDYDTAVVCQGFSRLVGSESACAGRLEVRQGQNWTRVCQEDIDIKAAQVVCQELGCGTALSVSGASWFEAGMGLFWKGSFECTGTELLLSACTRRLSHGEGCTGDSSIICSSYTGFRLVNSNSSCVGRIEVEVGGTWRSLCASDWDLPDAEVLCHHLGCGPASSPYAPFGRGTGRIWLHPVFCQGSEELLQDCVHLGWGEHFCGHELDVGVTCEEALELRLVDGGGPCAGRLEVKLQGHWGSVRDGNWNMDDAEVVCQQLGCGSAAGAYTASTRFRKGTGFISLARVDCQGDEPALWYCKIHGWGPYHGIHDYDTAVVCQGFSRLVGSESACAGRLEVRQGQNWTRVCQEDIDIKAAQVVCQELGCGTALSVSGASWFEAGMGLFWKGSFECTGTELLLSACTRRLSHGEGCTGDSSIICSSYTGFRLVNSNSSCVGRIEVEVGGTWRSLCASDWDLPDAEVLCHHLGCGPAVTMLPGGYFGGGDGTLRRDTFTCGGNEWHPGQCPTVVLGQPACPPSYAAAVNCSGSGTMELQGLWCTGTEDNLAQCNVPEMAAVPTGSLEEVAIVCSGSRQVMLAGGTGRCAGRVEVYINGTWGTVCRDAWDLSDATVVCRQLGCGTALAAPRSAPFGPGTRPLWLGASQCAGTEMSLWHC